MRLQMCMSVSSSCLPPLTLTHGLPTMSVCAIASAEYHTHLHTGNAVCVCLRVCVCVLQLALIWSARPRACISLFLPSVRALIWGSFHICASGGQKGPPIYKPLLFPHSSAMSIRFPSRPIIKEEVKEMIVCKGRALLFPVKVAKALQSGWLVLVTGS